MKLTKVFSSLLVAALGIVMATPANAGCTYTWTGNTSNDWQVPGNWSGGGIGCNSWPQSGDTAIIADVARDPVINDQDEAVAALTIEHDGKLNVTGQTLTVSGILNIDDATDGTRVGFLIVDGTNGKVTLTGNSVAHDIDGELWLSTNTSILEFTADVTVDGDGKIVGKHNSAQIEIANVTLINEMVIEGMMTIEESSGDATFVNGATGTVRANADGILSFASNLTLDDDASTSLMEAKGNSSAILKFNADATGLLGKFVLCKDTKFQFADGVDISTTGCLDEAAANGFLDFLGTGSFSHDDDECSGSGSAKSYTSDTEFTGTCND